MGRIYLEINSPEDIRRANEMIRDDMRRARTLRDLETLLQRSRYFITLTVGCCKHDTHPWRKKFSKSECCRMVRIAIEEYKKTREVYDEMKKQLGG